MLVETLRVNKFEFKLYIVKRVYIAYSLSIADEIIAKGALFVLAFAMDQMEIKLFWQWYIFLDK